MMALSRRTFEHRPSAVVWLVAVALLAGCRGQQTAPSDPFLPFMRSRVPPPGTTAAPIATDPYYQSGAPAGQPPVAAPPPAAVPGAGVPPATDKYSPRGGFNLPQSSIDRSKAFDLRPSEMSAGGTAVARRASALPPSAQAAAQPSLAATSTAAGGAALAGASVANAALSGPTAANPNAADGVEDGGSGFDGAGSGALGNNAVGNNARLASAALSEANASETGANPADGLVWNSGSRTTTTSLRILSPVEDSDVAADSPGGNTPATQPMRVTLNATEPTDDSSMAASQPESQTADAVAAATMTANTVAANTVVTADSAAQPAAGSPVVRTSWSEPTERTTAAAASAATAPLLAQPATVAASDDEIDAAMSAASPAAAPGQQYGYDSAYAALRGRLEYSQSSRQWKLRYIPIDGATDRFGGSVVLDGATKLEGYKAGDFVAVTGSLVTSTAAGRGFSPHYALTSIAAAGFTGSAR